MSKNVICIYIEIKSFDADINNWHVITGDHLFGTELHNSQVKQFASLELAINFDIAVICSILSSMILNGYIKFTLKIAVPNLYFTVH